MLAGAAPVAASPAAKPKRLLVVTVTKGFRHSDSIPVAERIIGELGAKSGKFTVDYVRTDEEMAQKMTAEALKNVDGVFFASTTGDLPLPDRDAFLKWLEGGKGFAGAHAAADTFHGFPPYIAMLGGEFETHGPQVEVECLVDDSKHPATRMIAGSVKVFDEIYIYKSYDRSKVHLLLGMDKHPNTKVPGHHPIAWNKEFGKGKVFYTALGHRVDVWEKPWFQEHVLGGILWSLGLEKGSAKLPKVK
jgi:type 1 glutamine amidotransferase